MMAVLLIFFTAFVASAALTWAARIYAIERALLDEPGPRRLHRTPTPRGGGIAIALSVCAGLGLLQANGLLQSRLTWAAVGFGFCFALLGWIDDHVDLRARLRLPVQLGLAGGFSAVVLDALPGVDYLPAAAVCVPAAVAIAWTVNLYNFMDGADGFAGSEAAVVAATGAVISHLTGAADTMLFATVLAGGAAGFLLWNWQPARIFMGDVGSYFLGFEFCALIACDLVEGRGPWLWLILLAPFVTDASLTLLWRFFKRERWWQAHRTHLYQRLIVSGRSDARVALMLVTFTIVLLAPAAWIAAALPALGIVATGVVYAFTGIIWLLLTPQQQAVA